MSSSRDDRAKPSVTRLRKIINDSLQKIRNMYKSELIRNFLIVEDHLRRVNETRKTDFLALFGSRANLQNMDDRLGMDAVYVTPAALRARMQRRRIIADRNPQRMVRETEAVQLDPAISYVAVSEDVTDPHIRKLQETIRLANEFNNELERKFTWEKKEEGLENGNARDEAKDHLDEGEDCESGEERILDASQTWQYISNDTKNNTQDQGKNDDNTDLCYKTDVGVEKTGDLLDVMCVLDSKSSVAPVDRPLNEEEVELEAALILEEESPRTDEDPNNLMNLDEDLKRLIGLNQKNY